jgi:hypothetical protein
VGDDVIVYADEQRSRELCRFHMLRQQWQRAGQTQFRSLADYIAPLESGRIDYLGAFAVSAGFGCDELAKKYDKSHDDYNSIMTKALADRLAEAFAEFLHFRARCDWGYGKEEKLSTDDLIAERYRGIRPAAGYPACPDHTEKGTLWQLRREGDRDYSDRVFRHVAGGERQWAVLRPSRFALLRDQQDRPRPVGNLRGSQRTAAGENRTLACAGAVRKANDPAI